MNSQLHLTPTPTPEETEPPTMKCVTHVIVPLKKVEPDDFSHIKQRTRFSRLKTVITILRKVVPSNLKLHDGYEEYIVPFLETVIRAQNRKNKTKVRRIQFMTWHRYLKKYTGPIFRAAEPRDAAQEPIA